MTALRDPRLFRFALGVGVLLLLRAGVAAILPLSFDEAYYWLWSKHLAAGYYDHPPMIAYVIRAGTALFGDTQFGVRAGAFILSAAATWAVWRAGAILLASEYGGAVAALFFNLMPMTGIETLAATPDAPEIASSAFLLWTLAKLAETGRPRWWIAAGAAAGFALVSKYTGFFLGTGILVWLAVNPRQRHWFVSPWPYLGAALALLMFAPVLWWNAHHGWASFVLQFGRVGGGRFTLRYLGEFLAAQLGLATPFIAILGAVGFFSIFTSGFTRAKPLSLTACLMAPAFVYFLWHSLHDRVQGNWPSFLYPAFAVTAVAAGMNFLARGPWRMSLLRVSWRLAAPMAAVMTGVLYAQALTGFIPLTRDPLDRLLAVGMGPAAQEIDAVRVKEGAKAVLTTSYAATGWFAFYLPSRPPVFQWNERFRWTDAPSPPSALFDGPLLYVTETWRDRSALLAQRFRHVTLLAHVPRTRNGADIEDYAIYRVDGPEGGTPGDAETSPP